nr:Xaa-Pro peptidase family protein [Comamonas testosteroni]
MNKSQQQVVAPPLEPHCAAPDRSEIARRVAAIRARMAELELDFYLCHDPVNVFYLTNFKNFVHERPFLVVIPASGPLIFLMPKLEESHVRQRAVGDVEFVHYFEFPAPAGQMWSDRLLDVIRQGQRIGLEQQCPLAIERVVERLVERAAAGRTIVADIVEEVREIKSAFEISRLAFTSHWLSQGHERLLAAAKPGSSVFALNSQIGGALVGELVMQHPDVNVMACEAIAVATPPSISHDPHLVPDIRTCLEEGGPHVTLVCGTANGYGAEVERTFFLGHVPEAAVRPFHDMLDARALAFELAVPGANMAEVDRRVTALLTARGYGDKLLHRTGHSFGVTRHEGPYLADGHEHEIRPHMLFSIEPGIYLPGIGGFRFSDTVLITETGNRCLTSAPQTLQELTLPRA